MNELQAIDAFHALAQETRLKIVRHLVEAGDDGASAGAISDAVQASSSNASFHLAALEHAGMIQSERQSRNIVYKADFTSLGGLVSFLLNDCCGSHPDVRSCCVEANCC